jgi:hypothetical protein
MPKRTILFAPCAFNLAKAGDSAQSRKRMQRSLQIARKTCAKILEIGVIGLACVRECGQAVRQEIEATIGEQARTSTKHV